jgi:hypothetical protein
MRQCANRICTSALAHKKRKKLKVFGVVALVTFVTIVTAWFLETLWGGVYTE